MLKWKNTLAVISAVLVSGSIVFTPHSYAHELEPEISAISISKDEQFNKNVSLKKLGREFLINGNLETVISGTRDLLYWNNDLAGGGSRIATQYKFNSNKSHETILTPHPSYNKPVSLHQTIRTTYQGLYYYKFNVRNDGAGKAPVTFKASIVNAKTGESYGQFTHTINHNKEYKIGANFKLPESTDVKVQVELVDKQNINSGLAIDDLSLYLE